MEPARIARARFASTRPLADRLTAVALVVVTGACGGESSGVMREPVARVVVSPDSLALVMSGTATATARVLAADGKVLTGRQVFWSSENSEIVSVDAGGRMTGNAPGTVAVAASSEGKSAALAVVVRRRVVATVRVNTASLQLIVGQSSQLVATPLDANGDVITERTVDFASSNVSVASVTLDGRVTALAVGSANVTASSGGQSAIVTVTVSPVPVASIAVAPGLDTLSVTQTTQLTATPRDAAGSALAGRVVTWRSSDEPVAAVSSNGVVTALAPGSATITAASGTVTGTARVVVLPRPVAAVVVSPSQATLAAAATAQLTVVVTDAAGSPVTGRPVTYASNANPIARVSATGLVTAVAPGTARITATSEGTSGFATITVTAVPVATVKVSPANDTIAIGGTTRLVATTESATGAVLTGRTVIWRSGAPTLATVDSITGVVTGTGSVTGIAVVFADSESRFGFATILVQRVAVATVVVNGGGATLAVGGSVQLTSEARDPAGGVVPSCVPPSLTWSSSDETVAVVSSTGRVTGLRNGSAAIRAMCEGVTGTSTITVR